MVKIGGKNPDQAWRRLLNTTEAEFRGQWDRWFHQIQGNWISDFGINNRRQHVGITRLSVSTSAPYIAARACLRASASWNAAARLQLHGFNVTGDLALHPGRRAAPDDF